MEKLIFSLILLVLPYNKSHSFLPEEPLRQTVFGVCIGGNSVSSDMTFAAITFGYGKMLNRSNISQLQFIQIAAGKWKSLANINNEDLFEKHEILGGILIDSISGEKISYCPALDSLWKLRYQYNPYHPDESGWAGERYKPNSAQAIYLYENYGIYNLNSSYFIDTNFWNILRDVTDPEWIIHYRALR